MAYTGRSPDTADINTVVEVGGPLENHDELTVDASGNVTLAGTVDGRDLSTDGTKLDGVEAGATNYQHPATHPASMLTGALPAIDGSALTNMPAGGLQVLLSRISAGSGSFVVPTGITTIYITGCGGGGGGGKGYGNTKYTRYGNGGTAGGICIRQPVTVTPGATYSWTVGAGGAGGSGTNSRSGSNGGASTVSGTGVSVSLGGGLGGYNPYYNEWKSWGGTCSGIDADGSIRGAHNVLVWLNGSSGARGGSGAPGFGASRIGPRNATSGTNGFGEQGYGYGAGGRGCATDQYNHSSYVGGPGRNGFLLIEA